MARKKTDSTLVFIITAVVCLPLAIIWLFVGLFNSLVSVERAERRVKAFTGKTTVKKRTGNSAKSTAKGRRKKEETAFKGVEYGASLYEALRLPSDPDPDLSAGEWFDGMDNEPSFISTDEYSTDEYSVAEEYDFCEEEDSSYYGFSAAKKEEEEVSLLGLFSGSSERDDGYEDDPDYSWETHCEFCGELLEDCVCDHRHESHEAIGLWDCGCDEEDGFGSDDNKKSGLLDFDEFRSF